MAGRPLLRKLQTRISEKPDGEEWVFEQLANGRTVAQVAGELGVSRRYLYYWRDMKDHKERRSHLWREAIKISAEVDVDLIEQEFDRLDRVIAVDGDGNEVRRIPHSSEVALATGRAKYRRWRASIKDPEKYASKGNQVNVQVNVGEQHIEALQRAKSIRPRNPEQLAAEVETDYEEEYGGPDYETE